MDIFTNISATSDFYNQSTTLSSATVDSGLFFNRHEFVKTRPGLAVPCLIILVIASIVGTFGNILTLAVICTKSKLRNTESIFIVNLAISDLYVTLLADPMSIVGKLFYM